MEIRLLFTNFRVPAFNTHMESNNLFAEIDSKKKLLELQLMKHVRLPHGQLVTQWQNRQLTVG